MNISENLIRIKQGKDDIITSLKQKGSDIADNTLINEIPTYIDNLPTGGGGDTPSQPDVPNLQPKYEGATVIRINVPTDNYKFSLNLCNDVSIGTYDVDWGDNTVDYQLDTDYQYHIYNKKGVYDINLFNLPTDLTLGGVEYYINEYGEQKIINNYLFNDITNDKYAGIYIQSYEDNVVTNVRLGDNIMYIGYGAFKNCKSLQTFEFKDYIYVDSNAFSYCSNLYYVGFNNTELYYFSFGDNAFEYCTSLVELTLPTINGGYGNFGYRCFQHCINLKRINNISDSMDFLDFCFSSCYSLEEITLPNMMMYIPDGLFEDCRSLKHIKIPRDCEQIRNGAFIRCKSLESIEWNEKITSIVGDAFMECSSLEEFVIPKTVTDYDFSLQSTGIKSFVFPNGITRLRDNMFTDCHSLEEITIPETVTEISNGVFLNCSNLQNVEIPETVTYIGDNAFQGCSKLSEINIPTNPEYNTIKQTTFASSGFKYIVVPNNITTIENMAFAHTGVECVDLGENVQEISAQSFNGCSYLNTIISRNRTAPSLGYYDNSIGFAVNYKKLYIYREAVGYDTGGWAEMLNNGWELKYIEDMESEKVPTDLSLKTKYNFFNDIKSIGTSKLIDYELVDNEYIYHFDDKITTLNNKIFYPKLIEEIKIPSTVNKIEQNVFRNAIYLKNITIPEGITQIPYYCFYNTPSLETITFPKTLSEIQNEAFYNVFKLDTIKFKNSKCPNITNSYDNFYRAGTKTDKPKRIIIPLGSKDNYTNKLSYLINQCGFEIIESNSTITYTTTNNNVLNPYSVGDNTIESNTYENGVGTLVLENNLDYIYPDMYANKSGLKSFEVPEGVTYIGQYAFYSSGLKEVTLPTTLRIIEQQAFNGCDIQEIEIPKKVNYIGKLAFSGNNNISKIVCKSKIAPSIENDTFNVYYAPQGATISLPRNSEGYLEENSLWYRTLISKGYQVETPPSPILYVNDNEIKYKTLSGGTANPTRETSLPPILSNTLENGIGTITCESDITELGFECFDSNKDICEIVLPSQITNWQDYIFWNANYLYSITLHTKICPYMNSNNVWYMCGNQVTDKEKVVYIPNDADLDSYLINSNFMYVLNNCGFVLKNFDEEQLYPVI